MHGLAVYVKEELLFAWDLENLWKTLWILMFLTIFISLSVLLLFPLSLYLMLGVFYAYTEEYKHNDCFLKTKPTFKI